MKYVMTLILLSLLGCTPLQIDSNPIVRPTLNLPSPDPIQLSDIHFITITKDNAIQVLEDLEKKGLKPVVIAITGNDYKILAVNINNIKDYIILQNEIIKKYKDYYEGK